MEEFVDFYVRQYREFKQVRKQNVKSSAYQCKFSATPFPIDQEILTYQVLNTKNPPHEGGVAFLWRCSEQLHVVALMEDPDVFNLSQPVNDRTWTKGDVMEFFYQPPDREDYFELHVAPNGSKLQLHLPNPQCFAQGYNFEDLVCETNMTIQTELLKCEGMEGWRGYMTIPFSSFGIDEMTVSAGCFSVCRYNYNYDPGNKPEISSTTFYPEGGFHQPQFWQSLKFV